MALQRKRGRGLLVFNEKGQGQGQGCWPLLTGKVNLSDPVTHSTAPSHFLSPALSVEASWENMLDLL